MSAEIINAQRVTHPPVRFIGKRFETLPQLGSRVRDALSRIFYRLNC
jgi:hypothetical protein